MVTIQIAGQEDFAALEEFNTRIGNYNDADYFKTAFQKDCDIYIALQNSVLIGYGLLNREPKYTLYKRLGIDEIQDLNVDPAFRSQGIGTTLIHKMEEASRSSGKNMIGISVGLTKDYGAAQRLYMKLGYRADGNGITHDRQPVGHGQFVSVDDDLQMMMIKEF